MFSTWETELARLRASYGHTRRMKVLWWRKFAFEAAAADLPTRPDFQWSVALFDLDAAGGDLPLVVVALLPVSSDAEMPQQGGWVDVAGRPEPGGAVAVRRPDGSSLWPAYPATAPRNRRYRWAHLLEAVAVHPVL